MLRRLSTGLGERSTYDAVSQCSRCGYCEQVCPTYVATGEEGLSPRGRNQMVRLLLEGKVEGPEGAKRFLDTCLLCGACSTACYAHVRVPDLVLEGRRLIRRGRAPWLARLCAWLQLEHPRLLEAVLTGAYVLKRWGLARLASRLGLPALVGLPGLAVAEEHVEEAPARLLAPELRERDDLKRAAGVRHLYFAACGTNYVLPRVGRATVSVLQSRGPTAFLDNRCCGLLSYNYGDVDDARELARRVIEGSEWVLSLAAKDAVIVADCSSCAAHLKSYPQLFLEDPAWRARAEVFASKVRDVLQLLGEEGIPHPQPGSHSGACSTYHDSCKARHGQGIVQEPRRFLREACGSEYRELAESDSCCGGAGAFSFLQPELADAVLRRKIENIADTQAKVVAASSTSCLLQLAHGLRKYYPECRVVHPSEIASEGLAKGPTEC